MRISSQGLSLKLPFPLLKYCFSLKALDPTLMLVSLMRKTVITISTEREVSLDMRTSLKTVESILMTMNFSMRVAVPLRGGGRRRLTEA